MNNEILREFNHSIIPMRTGEAIVVNAPLDKNSIEIILDYNIKINNTLGKIN